jgi:hypothetical protein
MTRLRRMTLLLRSFDDAAMRHDLCHFVIFRAADSHPDSARGAAARAAGR